MELSGARHRVSYMQNAGFSVWFHQLPHVRTMEATVPLLITSLLVPTYHRQPSRAPVEASRLLSVSEASVCSVDMDEMSLIEDD